MNEHLAKVFPSQKMATDEKLDPNQASIADQLERPAFVTESDLNNFLNSYNCNQIFGKFDKCLEDMTISTAIQTRVDGLKCTEIKMQTDMQPSQKELLEELISDSIPYLLSQAFWGRFYGMQVVQVLWGHVVVNGVKRVKPMKLISMPIEGYHIDYDGSFYEKSLTNDLKEVEPDRLMKYLYAVNDQDWGNPRGHALGKILLIPFMFKQKAQKAWKDFCQNLAYPFVHVKYKPCNDQKDKEFQRQTDIGMRQNFRHMITPDTVTVDAVSINGGTTTQKEYVKALCEEMTKYILGQTLTSQASATGSEALGRVHNEVRKEKIKNDFEFFEIMARQLAYRTMLYNGIQGQCPDFKIVDDQHVKKDVAERDKVLSDIGVEFSKDYFKDTYGLGDDDFEVKKPSPVAGSFSSTQKLAARAIQDVEKIENQSIEKSTLFGEVGDLIDQIENVDNKAQLYSVLADYQNQIDDAAMEGLELSAAAPYLNGANNQR